MKKTTLLSMGILALGIGNAIAAPSNIQKTYHDHTSILNEINVNGTNPLTWFNADATEKQQHEGPLMAFIEQSFSYFNLTNPIEGAPRDQAWYLLHAHLNIRLHDSDKDLGTWLKVEISGSSAFNPKARKYGSLAESTGTIANVHTDVFDHEVYYLPEVALLHSMSKIRSALIIGVVNQTNYIDINSYANTPFTQVIGSPYVNNQVIPLVDGNLGFVWETQFTPSSYIMLSASFTGTDPGHSPVDNLRSQDYNVMAEFGWQYESAWGEGVLRVQPFFFTIDHSGYAGIAANVEQNLGKSPFALFARAGWNNAEETSIGGATAQVSGGIIFKQMFQNMNLFKEEEGNFFGLAFNVTKPDKADMPEERSKAKREYGFEATYSFFINQHFCLQPVYQVTYNPALRDDTRSSQTFAIQCILSF